MENTNELNEHYSQLNSEQKRAFELAMAGNRIFLTGSGGTGKSFLVQCIVQGLANLGKQVALTATTGVAAANIGGVTLHSFAGIGLAETETREELRRKAQTKQLHSIWSNLDVLIIDEISMLSPEYLEKLLFVIVVARQEASIETSALQFIGVGDFFQIPPVKRNSKAKFCFQSDAWPKLFPQTVELQQVFRQTDASFVECLQRIRVGAPMPQDIRMLTGRLHATLKNSAGIKPTILFSRTDDVNRCNQENLEGLPGAPQEYFAVDGFIHPKEIALEDLPPRSRIQRTIAELRRNMPAEERVTLKVGAQVMLLTNLHQGYKLVNGSRGVIVGFTHDDGGPVYPVVRFPQVEAVIRAYMWKFTFRNGIYAYVAQIPLKLAYAFTIHKSQSQSIDAVSIRLDTTIFEPGQAYTALSRVRTLNGLTLSAFDPACLKAHPDVVAFYKTITAAPARRIEALMSRLAASEAKQDEDDDNEEDDNNVNNDEQEEEEEEEEEEPDEDPNEEDEDENENVSEEDESANEAPMDVDATNAEEGDE